MNHNMSKVHKITLTAILMAIILVMSFTPLGYLKVGIVSITFLAIPPLIISGMIYLVVITFLSKMVNLFEGRLRVSD